MLTKKTLLTLSIASLVALNVQAEEPQKNTNPKQTTTMKNTKNNGETKKAETKQTEDKNLTAFNQNVGIALVQRSTAMQDNQPVAVFTYQVANRGKNRIKDLGWLSAFTFNNQVFFIQEIKTKLDKAIEAGKTESITVVIPMDKLPENVRPVFQNLETPIGHLTIAREIDFTNGKKIVVTE